MAQSGLAVVDFLVGQGARVRAVDAKPLDQLQQVGGELERLGVPFSVQAPGVLDGADLVVVSPGVPADLDQLEAARRSGVPVLGEVELAGQFLQGKTIGITGANGKTTTTALIGHILKQSGIPAQVGGNIGTPVTAMIASSRPNQWNVLELSSFQLETIERFRAHIGACMNVTPDHLDRHHTFENYANAKARLFETQQAGDFAILNADDPTTASYSSRTKAHVLWFSFRAGRGEIVADDKAIYYKGRSFLKVGDIPLRGRHNVENTMAAAGAAHMAGASLEAIAAAVRTFPASNTASSSSAR